MRSMFSNRYDNKRRDYYERYEATRRQHPSLPLYERPVEPAELQVFESDYRPRHLSYRKFANQTSKQISDDSWLSSNRLPIVVRRDIEERNDTLLMPKYDPGTAIHEFSHNGKPRRGRPPAPATMAKLASDFAAQVGGRVGSESEEQVEELVVDVDIDVDMDTDTVESSKKSEDDEIIVNKISSNINPNQKATQSSPPYLNQNVNQNFIQNLTTKTNPVKNSASPKQTEDECLSAYTDDEEEQFQNPLLLARYSLLRSFYCPIGSCQKNFELRRELYKHQRDTGHHNWSYKCDKCGQIFRTAGFKRMHSSKACERKLSKFSATKTNEAKKPKRKPR
ncbi:uncharacterized protein LOC108117677 [Drosophila eugracilis]|uniref:uncharacterized protein LOC108117677 n=1 Tax=Drosophila eugracilis TaxID=29029 RepID=UPI0007E85EC2|nr:uncharacterized protein LOC108117677 [Drosophila eugracilis]